MSENSNISQGYKCNLDSKIIVEELEFSRDTLDNINDHISETNIRLEDINDSLIKLTQAIETGFLFLARSCDKRKV